MAAVVTREVATVLSLQSQAFENGFRAAISSVSSFKSEIRGVKQEVAGLQKSLDQGVAAPLKSLDAQVKGLSFNQLSGHLRTFGDAGASAFGIVADASTRFEGAMRRVNTIAGLGEGDFRRYSEQIRTLGPSLGLSVGPAASAASLYNVLSSNFRSANDASLVLTATLKAAAAGGAEADQASLALTKSLNAYGQGANQAAHFADVLFTTVDRGVITFPELSQSIGQVVGIAARAGISFEELNAAIATATLTQEPQVALEGLRNVIVHLLSPTKEGAEALANMKIVVNQQTLAQKGLAQTLIEINKAANGQVDVLEKVVGGHRGLTTALAVVGDGGAKFLENIEAQKNALGANDRVLKEQAKSLEFQIGAFNALGESVAVSVGDTALPALKAFTEGGTHVLNVFNALPEPLKADALLFTALGTAALFAFAGITGLLAILPAVTAGFTQASAAATKAAVSFGVTGAAATAAAATLAAAEATKVAALTASEIAFDKALAAEIAYGAGSVEAAAASQVLDVALAEQVVAEQAAAAATLENAAAQRVATATGAARIASLRSIGLLLGVVGVAAIGAGITIQALGDGIVKAEEAQQQFTKNSSDSLTDFRAAMEDSRKSVEELAKTNSTAQLRKEMDALKEAAEDVRERFNKGLLGKEQADQQINAVNSALQRLRDAFQAVAAAEARGTDAKTAPQGSTFVGPQIDDKDLKKLQKQQESARKEGLDKALDDIELLEIKGKITDQQKIARLKQILATYNLTASERRTLEERIARDEQRLATETARTHNEAQQARQQAVLQSIQIEKEGVDQQISELSQKAQKSAQFDGQLKSAIEKRLSLEIQEIKQQGEIAKAAAKSAEERTQIEANTQARIKNSRAEAQRDKAEPIKQRTEKEAEETKRKGEEEKKGLGSAEAERLGLQKAKIDEEIKALEAKRTGTQANVEQAVIAKIRERLAIQEQEIRLAAEQAKAQTESAKVREAIEVNAELKIQQAKRAAAEEQKKAHQEQVEASKKIVDGLEQQKKGIDDVKSALNLGKISTLDQALADQNAQFGIEGTRKRIAEQVASNARKPFDAAGGAGSESQLAQARSGLDRLSKAREAVGGNAFTSEEIAEILKHNFNSGTLDGVQPRTPREALTAIQRSPRAPTPDIAGPSRGGSGSQNNTINQSAVVNIDGKTIQARPHTAKQIIDIVHEDLHLAGCFSDPSENAPIFQ